MIDYIAPIGAGLAVIGFVWRMKLDTDSKRSELYDHIDKRQQENEAKYTHKILCDERSKHFADSLEEIKCDVKTLIRMNGKNKGD